MMITRCRPLLGTFVEITVPAEGAAHVDAAFAAIEEVQRAMSFHSEDSDLAALRNAAPGEAIAVSSLSVEVLRIAKVLHEQSGGLFDVAIGGELVRGGFLPQPEVARREWSGTTADIEILDDTHVVCHAPMLIDLGGIAKGYAVDRAVETLQNAGVTAGLVNAGGDLRMFGPGEWSVELRDADGYVRERLSLQDCAVASSANLADRRRRWWRVMTPHIGRGRKAVASPSRVTVIAPSCVIADAMTKIAMADPGLAQTMLDRQGARMIFEDRYKRAA